MFLALIKKLFSAPFLNFLFTQMDVTQLMNNNEH